MNRLILIGNGFDLAHGMKTSYNDFILWYLTQAIQVAYGYDRGCYNDGVLKVESHKMYYSPLKPDIRRIVEWYYFDGKLDEFLENGRNMVYTFDGKEHQLSVSITVRTNFLKLLFDNCSISSWVDIENSYYTALKQISDDGLSLDDVDSISDLNKTMEVLTLYLEKYLQTLSPEKPIPVYQRILSQELLENEFVHWDRVEVKELEQSLILNFNYTPTVDLYTRINDKPPQAATVNYIHGELGKPKNPMIFGFGDELDEHYRKLEEHQTKGIFNHIKSFWYFKTRNYHNLIRYLASGQYQVFILGHSCGLSDRTMLNMIFEHDNCMSIKIYYYQFEKNRNNYTTLTEEISRHFKSKLKMRERIVSFEDSEAMPQIS